MPVARGIDVYFAGLRGDPAMQGRSPGGSAGLEPAVSHASGVGPAAAVGDIGTADSSGGGTRGAEEEKSGQECREEGEEAAKGAGLARRQC